MYYIAGIEVVYKSGIDQAPGQEAISLWMWTRKNNRSIALS
jgi:hypothetical protein